MSEEKPPRPTIPPPMLPEEALLPPGKLRANHTIVFIPSSVLTNSIARWERLGPYIPLPGPCYEIPQLLLPDPRPRLEEATSSRHNVLLERVTKEVVEVLQAQQERKKAAPCYTPKKRTLVDPEVVG